MSEEHDADCFEIDQTFASEDKHQDITDIVTNPVSETENSTEINSENKSVPSENNCNLPNVEITEELAIQNIAELKIENEPSANISKENSAIYDKECLRTDIDEKTHVYSANGESENNIVISWSLNDNEFKLKWNVPEQLVSQEDYIALCVAGNILFSILLIILISRILLLCTRHILLLCYYVSCTDAGVISVR